MSNTAEYVPTVDEGVLQAVRGELAKKEQVQKKHYFMLNELQKMARELPMQYQQRLPYDLLTSLASALLDGTVYEIVRSLKEVQQLEERNLFQQRMNIVNEHKKMKTDMQRKQKEALQHCQMAKPHQLPYLQVQQERDFQTMEKKYEEELKRKDMKIILELDQKLMDQQVTLEKSGVPGFYVTNKPTEIKLQMHLLEFISRLSVMPVPL